MHILSADRSVVQGWLADRSKTSRSDVQGGGGFVSLSNLCSERIQIEEGNKSPTLDNMRVLQCPAILDADVFVDNNIEQTWL